MTTETTIKIPDIGGASQVDVIELLVKPGDEISIDTSLITLESEKASMDIPSPKAGRVGKVLLKVGDKVSEGDPILTLEIASEKTETDSEKTPEKASQPELEKNAKERRSVEKAEESELNVTIPDIGGATDVDVIDVMVKVGDEVTSDQALLTLEGDKATMDIPSPATGKVKSLQLKVGDKVSQGSPVLTLTVAGKASGPQESTSEKSEASKAEPQKEEPTPQIQKTAPVENKISSEVIFAGPAVRRLGREFGVNLAEVKGTGIKGRITREDVQTYVKQRLSAKPSSSTWSMPEMPAIDFSKFGSVEVKPLNKIKRLTGINVHRSWITVPHVTQFDEVDITDLEAFRKAQSEAAKDSGYKLTLLAFVTKVVCQVLKLYPQFNASLDPSGENLIYKNYFNIGIAVETPNGLVVPVIKGVDALSVGQIAAEMGRLSKIAREKGLSPADMSGGCFTISSLGGIGGTAFTPIVNAPEVAILGLSRSIIKPVYKMINNKMELEPRLMLPLSLSYDHRVIDGAEAARFVRTIAELLEDIRRIVI